MGRYWPFALLLLACCAAPDFPSGSAVELAKNADQPFASMVRSIDATEYRGRAVVVSARLRSARIAKGPNGVWVRADGPSRKLLGFGSSYHRPVIGDSGWTERSAVLDIDPAAERIVFGAMNASADALWVDDLRVQAVDESHIFPPSAAAAAYLEEAIERIRRGGYYSDRVDWARARSGALIRAAGAQTTAETYDALRYVLALLGDHHSHLVEPAEARDSIESTRRDFDVSGAILAEIGYVAVPGYNGRNAERSQAFSSAIQAHIAEAQRGQVCGWIVDLRNDTGGNMYPMLTGLRPLLGDGPLGYFHNRGGQWIAWTAPRGDSLARDASNDFVAVITGHRTASAGEAVALSFRGRRHTRSFGDPTAGFSTANHSFRLPDGAVIALTAALMADRDRNIAHGSIEPDEPVRLDAAVHLDDDPAIAAATAWLRAQSCGR
jgi:carboxyl-terminal processing protease